MPVVQDHHKSSLKIIMEEVFQLPTFNFLMFHFHVGKRGVKVKSIKIEKRKRRTKVLVVVDGLSSTR
jgi:hypothetical protein